MEVAANQKGSNQQLTVDNCSRTSKSTIHRRPQNHKIVYQGFLGSITAIVQSESEDVVAGERSKDTYAREEWSWAFIPSFLSRCVQVRCASFLGSVERTLRTCPVLPNDHQVWDMCMTGNMTSIRELFRTREISPYAINRNGSTLLHVSCSYTCSKINPSDRFKVCHLGLTIRSLWSAIRNGCENRCGKCMWHVSDDSFT
jgi:hypothetical protein